MRIPLVARLSLRFGSGVPERTRARTRTLPACRVRTATRTFFVAPAARSPRRQVRRRFPFFAFASLQAGFPFSFGPDALPASAGTVPLTIAPVAVAGPLFVTVIRNESLPPTRGRFGFGLIRSRRSADVDPGEGEGVGPGVCASSKAPMSQAEPWGRATPR